MTGPGTDTTGVVLHAIFENALKVKALRKGKSGRGTSEKTLRNQRFNYRVFQKWIDDEGIDALDVTPQDAMRLFWEVSPYEDGTNQEIEKSVAFAYEDAIEDAIDRGGDVVPRNPLKSKHFRFHSSPDPEDNKVIIPNATLRNMYQDILAGGTRRTPFTMKHLLLWGLLVYTGMRKDEVRRLTWEDIDWDARTLTFVGKFSKKRTIPIHPHLYEILDEGSHGGSWTNRSSGRTTNRVMQGAIVSPYSNIGGHYGVGGNGFAYFLRSFAGSEYTFHAFRKTLETSLGDNEVQAEVRDVIMGHSPKSIAATYYTKVGLPRMHKAMALAYADDPLDVEVDGAAGAGAELAQRPGASHNASTVNGKDAA
jgi:integrase